MATHTLQFNRPLAGAVLVNATGEGTGPTEGIHDDASNDVSGQNDDSQDSELQETLLRILAEVNKARVAHAENLHQVKTMSVQLAMILVKQMVGKNAAIQTLRLEKLLEEALDRGDSAIRLHLHSDNVSKLKSFAAASSIDLQQVTLVADDSVRTGECRVQYAAYQLTSDLERQIDETEHCLLEVVNEL